MNKKLLILALLAAAVLAGITKNGKLGVGTGAFAVVVLFIVSQWHAVSKTKPCRDISELDDDDGGIDWREENVSEEEFAMWKGWAVLMDDVAVHEAKAAAETLEKAQIRCRLELLKEDRAWHRYGNGGLGTRMCVLVAPSDYAAARKLVSSHWGDTPFSFRFLTAIFSFSPIIAISPDFPLAFSRSLCDNLFVPRN